LAISGMHLTILVGTVLLAARFSGRHGRWQGWLMIGVVLLYLFLVEARSPVLRAGIMSIAASLGIALDRRLRISSLVAVSAIALLLWQPQELLTPGFQLSYGVVLALLLFTVPVRARWSRTKPHEAFITTRMIWEACKTSTVVAIVAWLFATPLVMHHFGFVSIVGIPLSIVATPLVSGILLLGYAKLVAAVVLPSAAVVLGWPLIVLTDLLIWLAKFGESLPLADLRLPQPSMLWTLVALAWTCAWLGVASDRWRQRVRWLCIPIVIWAALPAFLPATSAALRIDMLSVGDGSCYLLRSGSSAVVFDAGSSSSFDAGRRTIVPALRALRVRSLDAVVISHANLDHYSGVLELVDALGVREVIVSPHFLHEAQSNAPTTSPVAFLTTQLAARNVPLRAASEGMQQAFGEATWTWLHPSAADSFRVVNNTSMVIRMDVASRTVLLTGDIQAEAIGALIRRHPDLRVDVSELPHHGSYNDNAVAFIERVNPSIIMQSTGWMRWRNDRWAEQLADRERLVTARDGACWIEIDDTGVMTFGRFRRWFNAPTHDDDRWE
jgi:competence protein ComEC